MCVPFYAYFPLIALGGGGYSYLAMQVGTLQSRAMHAKGRMLLSWWQQILGAPEKYIGFWLGNILAYLYYYLSVIVYTYKNNDDDNDNNNINIENDDHSAFQSGSRNPTHIAGLNCLKKDPTLFWTTLVFLFITLVAWLMIVWIFPDPGIVDTRESDFFEVLFIYFYLFLNELMIFNFSKLIIVNFNINRLWNKVYMKVVYHQIHLLIVVLH